MAIIHDTYLDEKKSPQSSLDVVATACCCGCDGGVMD